MQSPYYVGDWLVDADTNRITRQGKTVKLQGKVMAVLTYLAQRPHELVTREQLEQAIWGDTVVGYDALTRCIAQLRKALGDDTNQPRYIETTAKKGYRLIAPINDAETTAKESLATGNQPHTSRILIAIIAATLVITIGLIIATSKTSQEEPIVTEDSRRTTIGPPTIIVTPFQNLGDIPTQQYFADGMTADITTSLAKLEGINVIAVKQPATQYQSLEGNINYILSGSVRRAADRIRMNVNLIEGDTSQVLWSEKYDREIASLFALQDDMVAKIIEALSVTISETDKKRIARRYTANVDAYDDFLRGLAHYRRFTREDNLLARNFYQRAIDRDGNFARAWGTLALTYLMEYRYFWSDETETDMADRAYQYAHKSLSIDPGLPQAHWVLGLIHLSQGNMDGARKAANRTIELDPNYVDSYPILAYCEMNEGRLQDAITLVRKAMLLNPDYGSNYDAIIGQAYYIDGQFELAIRAFKDALEKNNSLIQAHIFLIASLNKQGKKEEAKWAVHEFNNAHGGINISNLRRPLNLINPGLLSDIKKQLKEAGFN